MEEDTKENLKLTKVAKQVFGENVGKLLNSLKARKISVRQIWELATPTIQCNNVIGKVVYGTTQCWICGLKVTQDAGMTPECEHILPIAQAAIYLKLYNSEMKKDGFKDYPWVENEYAWAHSMCNRIKSDTCPLVVKGNVFKVDEKQITELLKSIMTTTREGSEKLKANLSSKYASLKAFQSDMVPKIKERYDKIIEFIASEEKGRSHYAKLITLAGISGLSDIKYIRPELHTLLNPEEVAKMAAEEMDVIENESRIIESVSLYDDIQQGILSNIPAEFGKIVSKQPKYREFFQEININPDEPVRSLNPDNFQTQIFDFITTIYPSVYMELSKKARTKEERRKLTIDVLSKFIIIEIFSTIKLPSSNTLKGVTVPREFMKKMPGIINEVKAMMPNDLFTLLSTEYKRHDIDIQPAASILTSMKSMVKSSNFRKSRSKSGSKSGSRSKSASASNINSAAKVLLMLHGNTRASVKVSRASGTPKERTRKRRRTSSAQRSAGHSSKRRSSTAVIP
jgi:hypothetical protein